MSALIKFDERVKVYRDEIAANFQYRKRPEALYHLASLSLEDVKGRLESERLEPGEDELRSVAYRLDSAAIANEDVDMFTTLRARLLKAWMRPIIWSGRIDPGGLTDSRAKNISKDLRLEESGDLTSVLLGEALALYDTIDQIPRHSLRESDIQKMRELSGFINETTPVQLGIRHNTAKQFAIPSLAFDSGINPDRFDRVDGFYFDNRNLELPQRKFVYQTETSLGDRDFVLPNIPIISAAEMGNSRHSRVWIHDHESRPFGTARRLVTERKGKRLSPGAKRILDRLSSSIFKKITNASNTSS